MIAQIVSSEPDIDFIRFIYPDGCTFQCIGWTDEDFVTGEVTYFLKNGDITIQDRNNELIESYKSVKLKAKQSRITAHNNALDALAYPDLFERAEYLKARELIFR